MSLQLPVYLVNPINHFAAVGRAKFLFLLRAIAPHAQIGLCLVPSKILDGTKARAVLANQRAGFGFYFLISNCLEKFADP